MKDTKNLLQFWEEQMRHSHRSSNYFFRKSPSHYHMMLLVMSAHKTDQRKKNIKPSGSFVKEFDDYIITLKNLVL